MSCPSNHSNVAGASLALPPVVRITGTSRRLVIPSGDLWHAREFYFLEWCGGKPRDEQTVMDCIEDENVMQLKSQPEEERE